MNKTTKTDLSALLSKLPAIIARKEVPKLLGNIISRGYLQNLDSEGKGPKKIRCGKRTICYLASDLISWLESRSETIENSEPSKS